MKKKILITDDHYVVRMGTGFILESKLNYPCSVDFADCYTDARNKVSQEEYDLLILDIDMPDSIFQAMVKELKSVSVQKNLKIAIFSVHDADVVIRYIQEGADGYINKNSGESEILNAVNCILDTGYYYSQQIMNKILNLSKNNNPLEKLSEREFQVFKLLAEGNGNIEISNILNLQMSTISTYKKKIFEKLKVKTVVDLVRIYDEMNWE